MDISKALLSQLSNSTPDTNDGMPLGQSMMNMVSTGEETPEEKAARILKEKKTDKPIAPVNDKIRTDWNQYVDWLEKKGLKGSPSLDKDDLGRKMVDQYVSENPGTSVTRENIMPIQNEFRNYRQSVIDQSKAQKSFVTDPQGNNRYLEKDENPEWLMRSLSVVDDLPGQRTTTYKFPSEYLTKKRNDEEAQTQRIGFSKKK